MTPMVVWIAIGAGVALILVIAFILTFVPTFTRDRPEHQPDPIRAAQHHVADISDPHYRPGDDDQWHRMRTLVRHINRGRHAEKEAERTGS